MALKSIFFATNSIILVALIFCISFVNVSSYINRTLESGKVCHLNSDKGEIVLEKDEYSAVVITENGFFSSWTGRYNFHCHFKVRTHFKGIYAVIQDLNFRKNSTTGECIDYISFGQLGDFFKTTKYKKYCGFLRPGSWFQDSDYSDEEIGFPYGPDIAPNAFISNGSVIEVEIFVSNVRLAPYERLVVNLVFTAFQKEGCNNKNMLRCRQSECIWRGFKNDGYQNCPYGSCADEEICTRDEEDTSYFDRIPKSSGIGTKVTIGAVASIIIMLVLFAACLCICKKFGCLCWGAAPVRRPPVSTPREVERVLPSAPMELETKDLPPSYDSLFPAQS